MKRNISLIILSIVFALVAHGNVLNTKITLNVSSLELGIVLKKIENQAHVSFAYKSSAIDKTRKITLNVSQFPLGDVLKILLFDDGAKFSVLGSQIIIFQAEYQQLENASSPIRDTIWTNVVNTTFVTDTHRIEIIDTLTFYDTILVKSIVKRKMRLTRREKFNFVVAHYKSQYNSISFDIPENEKLIEKNSYQLANELNFLYGKSSKKWEISTGLGVCVLNQSISIENSTDKYYYDVDTTIFTIITRDSSAIIIPGIDTIYIVDDIINYKYEYDSSLVFKTITEKYKNKNTLYYVSIPINISFKRRINKNSNFIMSLNTSTKILLNSNYKQIQYKDSDLKGLNSLKPEQVFINGTFAMGFDRLLKEDLRLSVLPYIGFRYSPMLHDDEFTQKNTIQLGLSIGIMKYF